MCAERDSKDGRDDDARGFPLSAFRCISLQPFWPMSTSSEHLSLVKLPLPTFLLTDGNIRESAGSRRVTARVRREGVEPLYFFPQPHYSSWVIIQHSTIVICSLNLNKVRHFDGLDDFKFM
jgi:hypothetical protein